MRTPRHRKARITDLQALRALYRGLQQLETAFFPSGAHYQAISKVTRAARHCAVVWSGDEGAFTANENVCFRRYRSSDQNPFPGPKSERREAGVCLPPPMTVGVARSVLNAHPEVGSAEHKPVRSALNSLPADMTEDELGAVWLRIAELFEDLPLVSLQAVRAKLDGEGSEAAATSYWFTPDVYRHAILCETTPLADLSEHKGQISRS